MLGALDTHNADIQHLGAVILAADPDLGAELKGMMNSVVQRVATASDASPKTSEARVYQLAVQRLPLSGFDSDR